MKIPKVSLDILNSTTTSITDGKKHFWDNAIDTMKKENPLLYQLLVVSETNTTKGDEFQDGYKRGAALMYILLSRQAEADDMNEAWG